MIEFGVGFILGTIVYRIYYESQHIWDGPLSRLKKIWYAHKANKEFKAGKWKAGNYFADYNFTDYQHDPDNYRRLFQIIEVWDSEIKYIELDNSVSSHKNISLANAISNLNNHNNSNVMKKYKLVRHYKPYLGTNKFTKKDSFKEQMNEVLRDD